MKDFFISYTKADAAWAEWIAWTLENAGHSVIFQLWHFRPGGTFVLDMQRATMEANKTIVVLSPSYLEAKFTQSEWVSAFMQDPEGKERKLIPVRIVECSPKGILGWISFADLVGLPEDDARATLLGAISESRPGPALVPFPKSFPGQTSTLYKPLAGTLSSKAAERPNQAFHQLILSLDQRAQVVDQLCGIASQHFDMLVFAIKPPVGVIPLLPATQKERATALLDWADSPNGCGASALEDLLETVDTALFNDLRNHLQHQWSNPSNPDAPSCYVALELSVYAGYDQGFRKLLEAQSHNALARETYKRVRRKVTPENRFWMLLATHHQLLDVQATHAQGHIEWQCKNNPASLYRAWHAWQASLSSGSELDQLKSILELCSGQRHNPNAMELYRAIYAKAPDKLMSSVRDALPC
jgi:TIR domain